MIDLDVKGFESLATSVAPGNDSEKKLLEEISKVKLTANQIRRTYDALEYRSSRIENVLEECLLSLDKDFFFWEKALKDFPSFRSRILSRMSEKAENVDQHLVVISNSWGLSAYASSVEKATSIAASEDLKKLVLASDKIPAGTKWFYEIWRKIVDTASVMSAEDLEFFHSRTVGRDTKEYLKKLLDERLGH